MKSFGESWKENHGAPIENGNQIILPSFSRNIDAPSTLKVKVLRADTSILQAVTVSLKGGHLLADGEKHRSIVCWYDREPWYLELDLVPNDVRATVKIWNTWKTRRGEEVAWVGFSGMIVEEISPSVEWMARCSSHMDKPSFDDLVIQFKILPGAQFDSVDIR
ncbi:hypothetical protein [Fimbriimonas ginsengisoli]|uniref:hypothetical protein n=1 Tax=Fimbriimonas ginsengisoli TaxID=1005039 RepID=UPI0011851463|nr:hypothetical protein [Fimbriimonas ginsengisoli]